MAKSLLFLASTLAITKAQFDVICGATTTTLSAEIGMHCLSLTNKYRAEAGVPLLKWSQEIHDLAYQHSMDMADVSESFGHANYQTRLESIAFD